MVNDVSAAERDPFASLTRIVRAVWIWGRRIAIGALIAAGAVILLESVHLHQLLASVHPWLAWTVSGALLTLCATFAAWSAWRWFSVPRVISPPELPAPEDGWSARQTRIYLKFARRYLERQQQNPALPDEIRLEIPRHLDRLRSLPPSSPPQAVVEQVEGTIDQLLEPIDRKARAEVWQSASQVAVLTAVNPSAMLDVLITLMRNLELMARLARLYYGRPGLWGTFLIVRDVMAVAATAGVVERVAESAGSVAAEMMGSWTARFAGPVGQGLTNGLLTVRLGDAAVVRCRSLRSRRVGIKPWSATMWREMARRLSATIGDRMAPEVARAFRAAARTPSEQPLRRAAEWVRQILDGSGQASAAGPSAEAAASTEE